MMAIDKDLVRRRFSKAAHTYDQEAAVLKDIATEMCRILHHAVGGHPVSRILEIGCGTGIYTSMIQKTLHPERLHINDISPEMGLIAKSLVPNAAFICGDAETVRFPDNLDLITSCSAMQWLADLDTFLKKCHGSLAPGGLLVFSTFGKDNLTEIRSITGTGLDYPTLEELEKGLYAAGLSTTLSKQENIRIWFPSPLDAIRHLKKTGVTATGKEFWSKGDLETFCKDFRDRYGREDGAVPVTYHPIFMAAKKG